VDPEVSNILKTVQTKRVTYKELHYINSLG